MKYKSIQLSIPKDTLLLDAFKSNYLSVISEDEYKDLRFALNAYMEIDRMYNKLYEKPFGEIAIDANLISLAQFLDEATFIKLIERYKETMSVSLLDIRDKLWYKYECMYIEAMGSKKFENFESYDCTYILKKDRIASRLKYLEFRNLFTDRGDKEEYDRLLEIYNEYWYY